jgi:cytosine/adenosine deaminase-related metal-dependent hydrolase
VDEIYKARWIFPMCQPPINGGFVRVARGKIIEIGSIKDFGFGKSQTIDLGDVALLPRMVNAHTHLEFSDCKSVIGQPGIPLADWIGKVIAARGASSIEQRQKSIAMGMEESVAAGVGLVGDIATTPSVYPVTEEPLVLSFAEVLGLSSERGADRLAAAEEHEKSLTQRDSVPFAVSPHAPYSTPMELVRRCVQISVRNRCPLAMHLAESPDERELLESGTGRFADSLRDGGFWRPGLFPWTGDQPMSDLIGQLSKSHRALLIHGNDLKDAEIDLIARYDHISVIYCPRTHDFFGYNAHPVAKLIDAGIRVAIGTDSRASNPDLSVWREVQFLLHQRPDLDPYTVLQMATQWGADALLGADSGFGTMGHSAGGIESLVAVATEADQVNQVWRDFAVQELLPMAGR